jgi:ankyrin repeat protein
LDSDSNTPLHIALENNVSMDMLDFLISMDYPINTRNKEGITPLSIAVSKKLIGHTKTLLENGADPFVTDNTDECPISIILKQPNDKVREEILNNIIKKCFFSHSIKTIFFFYVKI